MSSLVPEEGPGGRGQAERAEGTRGTKWRQETDGQTYTRVREQGGRQHPPFEQVADLDPGAAPGERRAGPGAGRDGPYLSSGRGGDRGRRAERLREPSAAEGGAGPRREVLGRREAARGWEGVSERGAGTALREGT